MCKLCYFEMRWYPLEIRQLVSTHSFPPCSGEGYTLDQLKSKITSTGQMFIEGRGGTLDQLQSKVPSPGQIFMGGGGGEGCTLDQLKPEVPSPDQFFISWKRGYSGHYIPQRLEWGTQGILSTQFSQPKLGPASQIVSHTLCVCRLMKTKHNTKLSALIPKRRKTSPHFLHR